MNLILACPVALLLFAAGCGMLNSGPGATVEEFTRHVEAGETSQAAEMLAGDIATSLGPDKLRQVLAEQTRQIQEKGGIESIDIEKEDVIGETAEVTVLVTYGNGTTQRDTTKLVQNDGEWKIAMSK